MEALIKALGQIPKWFTTIALVFVTILLGVATYSAARTIVFDCGAIEVAGTVRLGDHCRNVATSNWSFEPAAVADLDEGAPGHLLSCAERAWQAGGAITGVTSAGESVLPEGTTILPQLDVSESRPQADVVVVWHKVRRGPSHYDLLYQCLNNGLLTVVSGPTDQENTTNSLLVEAETAYRDTSTGN